MKKPLRIAIYSGEIPSTTFIERLINGISASGNLVLLFGILKQSKQYSKNVQVLGYDNRRISKLWFLIKYGSLLFLFKNQEKKRLDHYLKHENKTDLYTKVKCYPVLWYQPDIFHIQWVKGLGNWMWVQEFGIKLVLSLRGAHINYSPISDQALAAMYKKNFPKVDGFHGVSLAIAHEASKYGAKPERVKVVKSGLDLERFEFKLKEFDSKLRLNILSVGRDHWIKNYRLALDAMSKLKQLSIPFHYNIIGVSENEALAFQRVQLGLEKEVEFIDSLPFKEVQEAIQQADVLFLPSLKEGIANVVLEAMALGTLVISTDCGGMSEVVIPNQTGFLVPVRDAQAMSMALSEVSKLSKEAYQEITSQARRFIEIHHSEKHMVEGMLDLYDDLK